VLPFVTEEVWSWWQPGSIHTAAWPRGGEFEPALPHGRPGDDGDSSGDSPVLEVLSDVLGQVRGAKSAAKRSMRWPVTTLTVADTPERIAALLSAEDDLRDAGSVATLVTVESDQAEVRVELAEAE